MTERFLRIGDVMEATGLGRSTIYRLVAERRFPQPVKPLGPKTTAWVATEVEAWQAARIAERDSGKAPEAA